MNDLDTGGIVLILGFVGGIPLLAFVGTLIELVKIYRQPEPEKVRRTGSYFIYKVFIHAGAALAGGLISTIYFMNSLEMELRQISLLLFLAPLIFYYRAKWKQLKDFKWYTYTWLDFPMLVVSTWIAAFAINVIMRGFPH